MSAAPEFIYTFETHVDIEVYVAKIQREIEPLGGVVTAAGISGESVSCTVAFVDRQVLESYITQYYREAGCDPKFIKAELLMIHET